MSTLRTIEEDIDELGYIRNVLETYESVAATYMRRTKQSIVESRVFYDGLHGMYDEVSYAYQNELAAVKRKRSLFRLSYWKTLARRVGSRREVAVWLSANTGLYGDIIQKTFQSFLRHISATKSDVIVVGRRGKLLFEEHMPRSRYIYRDLPDNTTDMKDIISLMELFSHYRRIHVFYGKFESFVSQIPTTTLLSEIQHQISPATAQENKHIKPTVQYLFEPSLQEVAHFFETEILASLFQQITQESRLAKLAARMFQLDAATENIGGVLSAVVFERQKLVHQLENKKQLELANSRIAIGI